MGRGGRGGGGGRSSGGSRGRSSGGRMSSGGRGGRSSFSSGPRRSGYRPPPPGHMGWRPRRTTHVYHHSGGSGCAIPFIVFCFLFLFFCFALPYAYFVSNSGGSSITKSTVEREPLEASAVITTDYYHDELGWIRSATKLEDGMKSFFQETGVQPFLYITDTVNGTHYPTADDMDTYANDLYDAYIEDEGHILVLFSNMRGIRGYTTLGMSVGIKQRRSWTKRHAISCWTTLIPTITPIWTKTRCSPPPLKRPGNAS